VIDGLAVFFGEAAGAHRASGPGPLGATIALAEIGFFPTAGNEACAAFRRVERNT